MLLGSLKENSNFLSKCLKYTSLFIQLVHIAYSVPARYHAKALRNMNSLNHHSSPVRKLLLLSSLSYRGGSRGTEKLINLLGVLQLVKWQS